MSVRLYLGLQQRTSGILLTQLSPDLFESFVEFLFVPVGKKSNVSGVRSPSSKRMPNRTPVLLVSRCNLSHKGNHAVEVAAIDAVQALDPV